jgi:TatD DNase family protein
VTSVVDTHCHLGDPAFDADRDDAVARMRAAGVAHAVVIESDLDRLHATRHWVARHQELVWATGCHPHDAVRWAEGGRDTVLAAWRGGAAAAGEMGLDYHYDHAPRAVQQRVFSEQLALAVDHGLPAVIHAREADADVAAILREQPTARVILHSFSSDRLLFDAGLDLGCWFSFSGMVTFKSWQDTGVVAAVPADRLLIETDAPYLAPVPHRGQRNEPAFVVEVARRVAEWRGVTTDAVAALTHANATALFGLDCAACPPNDSPR